MPSSFRENSSGAATRGPHPQRADTPAGCFHLRQQRTAADPRWCRWSPSAWYIVVVHQGARVVVRAGEDAVNAAALHAEISTVVDGEDRGFPQVLLEHVLLVRAVDAHHLEALVDGVEHSLARIIVKRLESQFSVRRDLSFGPLEPSGMELTFAVEGPPDAGI